MGTLYKDKEAKELLEILDRHETLTFQSQLALQNELKIRSLDANVSPLAASIQQTTEAIRHFRHIGDLGFTAVETGDGFTIKRTTKALLTDLLAIFLGLVLTVLGLSNLLSLTLLAPNDDSEFSIGTILTLVLYGAMTFIGIKFLNGVKRFIDFLGFELSKSPSAIRLRKRFDMKLEERPLEISSLSLEEYKNRLILKGNEHALLDANANDLVQKLTIEALYEKLKA